MAAFPTAIVVDVLTVTPDAATIDALARLQLNAQRLGQLIHLRNASRELRDLIALSGLDEVLRLEPGRQPEEREERLGVEEEGQLGDTAG